MADEGTDASTGDQQTDTTTETTDTSQTDTDLGDGGKKALEAERAAKREAVKQARELKAELDTLRQESMSDAEKAVSTARAEERATVLKEMGGRLVDAEVRAACANRRIDVDVLLEGLDRSKFLTDDGEPDTKAITAYVDRIAPAGGSPVTDLSQGRRGGAGEVDMNARIRGLAGRG